MKITIFHRGFFWQHPNNYDEWPPNSPDRNPLDYHVWRAMLERHFNPSQFKYHQRAKESLTNNMGWSVTELHQQGHTELCQKTSSVCENWGRTLWTRLQINCFRRVLNC